MQQRKKRENGERKERILYNVSVELGRSLNVIFAVAGGMKSSRHRNIVLCTYVWIYHFTWVEMISGPWWHYSTVSFWQIGLDSISITGDWTLQCCCTTAVILPNEYIFREKYQLFLSYWEWEGGQQANISLNHHIQWQRDCKKHHWYI